MEFRRQDRERVANGEVTVTFRLWKTAKVKAGRQYRWGKGAILVEAVDVMPAALIAEKDVPRSGCADREAFCRLAGAHTRTVVGPDTLVHRVQFRYLRAGAEDPFSGSDPQGLTINHAPRGGAGTGSPAASARRATALTA